ncbi:MAG: UPF0175 family protein [Pseudomonadota bacterium]|nr:UPF0175 family protein [Pseudomonadota bacterium]MDP1905879.1 UPF0175 family protein [Pseudomonadota bacterium]MDP2351751.1 UPF0175 family protein [Pseudomonadota bacterium]
MNAVMLELPLDALASPGVSPESLASEAKFMLALKRFEVGRLSSGKAGEQCGWVGLNSFSPPGVLVCQ